MTSGKSSLWSKLQNTLYLDNDMWQKNSLLLKLQSSQMKSCHVTTPLTV